MIKLELFLDPETVVKCQFLNKKKIGSETVIMYQFLNPGIDKNISFWISKLTFYVSFFSGSRNWHYGSVSGSRNWHYGRGELYVAICYILSENNRENIGPLILLPVYSWMPTDSNVASRAKLLLSLTIS